MPDTETLPRLLTIKQAAEHHETTRRKKRRLGARTKRPSLAVSSRCDQCHTGSWPGSSAASAAGNFASGVRTTSGSAALA